ncbi:Arginase (EC [Olavius sp. associated proteobacterium Delta 1]|nr:Arginase (EC [Olavius sp. associated proteobacterium Delta 1]
MSAIHRPLADFARLAIEKGNRPISIAGDCCSAIGVLAGLRSAAIDPILIWFDAHGDFNTWQTTPSGFLGGMPLAMLVGTGEQTMLKALNLKPLSEDRVILTDARDLDPGEKLLIEEANIILLTDVRDLLKLTLPDAPLYIHLDMDIVTAEQAPAMNYPAAGGPSAKELQTVMKHLNRTEKIAAVSVSSWNPKMDEDGLSRKICMGLLSTLING